MKRFLYTLILLLSICGYAKAEKEYTTLPSPDAMYFVIWTNLPANCTNITITNNETYMWYPMDCRVTFSASALAATVTVTHIANQDYYQYTDTSVVTNDFGNVQTNYIHAVSNKVTRSVTNVFPVITGTFQSTNFSFLGEFIQRGDVTIWDINPYASNKWLKVTGWR